MSLRSVPFQIESISFIISRISSTVCDILRRLSEKVFVRKLIALSTEEFDQDKVNTSFLINFKINKRIFQIYN